MRGVLLCLFESNQGYFQTPHPVSCTRMECLARLLSRPRKAFLWVSRIGKIEAMVL
ncbi:hypothetical protein P3T31_000124 [Rhizobium sp. AN70]|nr:hypothetical protein [Rhizobium sp. AN70]